MTATAPTRRRATITVALAALVSVLLGACSDDSGQTGSGGDTRTVEVEMVDIAFEPDEIEVAEGETVRFVFHNRGESAHDAFIGDEEAQAEHEADMREGDAGHGGHGEKAAGVTVEPGERGELTHTFDDEGTVLVGCHQPGHYEAGMKITVTVA